MGRREEGVFIFHLSFDSCHLVIFLDLRYLI